MEPRAEETALCTRIETTWYDPVAAEVFRLERAGGGAASFSGDPAMIRLRGSRERYDLIVIESMPGGREENRAVWAVETLERAVRRLAPKGMLALLVRPADCDRTELVVMTATFNRAVPGFTRAALVGSGANQVLVLLGCPDGRPRWDWDAAAQAGMRRIGSLRSFLRLVPAVVPNSLRRPAFSRADPSAEGGMELVRYVSQTSDWRELEPGPRPVPIMPPDWPGRMPIYPTSTAGPGPSRAYPDNPVPR